MKSLPVALLLLSLIFIGLIVGYFFAYQAIQRASIRANELASLIELRGDEAEQARGAQEALDKLVEENIAFDRYFVPASDVVPFLEGLEDTGRMLGAQVEVVSVEPVDEGGKSRLSVSMQIEGSFESVFRALGTIEHGPYDLITKNLSLSTIGGDSESGGGWLATVVFSVGTKNLSPTDPMPSSP